MKKPACLILSLTFLSLAPAAYAGQVLWDGNPQFIVQPASHAPNYNYYALPLTFHRPNPGYASNSTAFVQSRLMQLGYWVGPRGADGIMSQYTRNAIKQFQRDNELAIDGVVGKQTLSALDQIFADAGQMPPQQQYYR